MKEKSADRMYKNLQYRHRDSRNKTQTDIQKRQPTTQK